MKAVLASVSLIALATSSAFAADGDKPDKSLFERNHEALERAQNRGDVERPVRPDRFINDSERRQMQQLERNPNSK